MDLERLRDNLKYIRRGRGLTFAKLAECQYVMEVLGDLPLSVAYEQLAEMVLHSARIKVVSLNETDDQLAAHGEFVRNRIETLLREMGFDHPFTRYASWYAGTSNHACGGGHGHGRSGEQAFSS